MLKELRRQFVMIIMSIFSFLVLALFLFVLGTFSMKSVYLQKKILTQMQNNRGINPRMMNLIPPHLHNTIFFYVEADSQGTISLINPKNFSALSKGEITSLLQDINNQKNNAGKIRNYRYFRIVSGRKYTYSILDANPFISTIFALSWIMGITIIIALIIIFGLSLLLSNRAVKTAEDALTKQKIFISDAGHEIKTPLAVIGANVSVLELELDENQWIKNIKAEIKRLTTLTNDLLTLTKLEHYEKNYIKELLNLSAILESTSLSFESRCFECKKNFNWEIEPEIFIMGNQAQLEQLFLIFLDNAVKYSNKKGRIQLTLKKSGSKAIFSIANTGDKILPEDKFHIFERFYRTDSSRTRSETTGFGLGLSIASEIAQAHNTTISVEDTQEDETAFSIIFPLLHKTQNS